MNSGLRRQLRVISDEPEQAWLRIAFATDDGEHVNQHFGTTESLAIYGVQPDSYTLLEAAQFDDQTKEQTDDKLAAKLDFLTDCVAVYCRACGASAVKQLLDQHVQPLKVVDDTLIKNLISAFQKELSEGPSSWLARAIQRQHDLNEYRIESDGMNDR